MKRDLRLPVAVIAMFVVACGALEAADDRDATDEDETSGGCSASRVTTDTNAQVRDDDGVGVISQDDVCVPGLGRVSLMTLRYSMDSYFGEPTRKAVFAYEAGFDISDASWVAQVFEKGGAPVKSGGEDVFVAWAEGTWPKPGKGFGTDTTGSPSWSQTFGFFDDALPFSRYVSEADAKAIYRAGFTLNRLQIRSINGKPVRY